MQAVSEQNGNYLHAKHFRTLRSLWYVFSLYESEMQVRIFLIS